MGTDTHKNTTHIVTTDDPGDTPLVPPVPPRVGVVYCLVEWARQAPGRGSKQPRGRLRGNMLTTDPRTATGRKVLWTGWLGTTSGIHRQALGAYRVEEVAAWETDTDTSGRWYWQVSLTPAKVPKDAVNNGPRSLDPQHDQLDQPDAAEVLLAAAQDYSRALKTYRVARQQIMSHVADAARAGLSEQRIASVVGVTRQTIRAWLNKS